MLISQNIRILTNFTKNIITNRNLRCVSRRKDVIKYLPPGINGNQEKDEVKLAQKELADLTGGLSVEQLGDILKPKRRNHIKSQKISNNIQPAKEIFKDELVSTYNLATHVNDSILLQYFVKLGVDLSVIEKRKGWSEFVLRLYLNHDVNPRLMFLKDHGVPSEIFGKFITENPLIFKVNLKEMQARVDYMKTKSFSTTQIQRILTLNPYWLMFSKYRIDNRLNYFQREFFLNEDELRFLASQLPRLITYNMECIRKATFSVRVQMGFSNDESKCLLLSKPRLWMLKNDDLVGRYAYAHQEMQLSNKMILDQAELLTCREFRLRQRHEFLKMLGRAQYDPEKDMHISPKSIVEGNNHNFAHDVAKCDIETFELFLERRREDNIKRMR